MPHETMVDVARAGAAHGRHGPLQGRRRTSSSCRWICDGVIERYCYTAAMIGPGAVDVILPPIGRSEEVTMAHNANLLAYKKLSIVRFINIGFRRFRSPHRIRNAKYGRH